MAGGVCGWRAGIRQPAIVPLHHLATGSIARRCHIQGGGGAECGLAGQVRVDAAEAASIAQRGLHLHVGAVVHNVHPLPRADVIGGESGAHTACDFYNRLSPKPVEVDRGCACIGGVSLESILRTRHVGGRYWR